MNLHQSEPLSPQRNKNNFRTEASLVVMTPSIFFTLAGECPPLRRYVWVYFVFIAAAIHLSGTPNRSLLPATFPPQTLATLLLFAAYRADPTLVPQFSLLVSARCNLDPLSLSIPFLL